MARNESTFRDTLDQISGTTFSTGQINGFGTSRRIGKTYNDDGTVTSISITSRQIAEALVASSRYALNGNAGLLVTNSSQPSVEITCSLIDLYYDLESQNLNFGNGSQENLNHLVTTTDLKKVSSNMIASNNATPSKLTVFWRESPKEPSMHSLLFAEGFWDSAIDWNSPPKTTMGSALACIIDAFWVQSSIHFNLSGNTLQFQLRNPEDQAEGGARAPIVISTEWAGTLLKEWVALTTPPDWDVAHANDSAESAATFLLLGISDAISTTEMCYANQVARYGPGDPDAASYLDPLPSSVVKYMNETGLIGHYDNFIFCGTEDWTEASNLTQLPIQEYRYDYGYDSSTIPVQLSLAILLTYCLIATFYIVFILFTGRTASSWDTISELLMLGVHSRTPVHLSDTSVGIDTVATFQEPVSIRINENNRAELVFDNDAEVKKRRLRDVVPNEAY